MTGDEDWRRNADTHKMSPEEVKKAGVEGSRRPPGHHPGDVLHQRRSLPFSTPIMAAAGFLIVATVGYLTLYAKKKPEADALDVARVSANVARPEDTHPRK
ncbi:uncharacterized protein LOC116137993 [Pistacia vera]|uniref:uncharacterized protein LOC116137993 n=1 Tax=Pistacia vera TaxID=55513 RepID=UPI001262D71E|nr:uncharacterized protein LOC116137993 [Pistacia vera]